LSVSDCEIKRLMMEGFLPEMAHRRWRWGECDCTMMAGEWIKRLHGLDLTSSVRGAYRNARGARAMAEIHGGFVPAVSAVLDRAGFARAKSFETGDVAIVLAPKFLDLPMVAGGLMALRSGDRWIVKTMRGLTGHERFQVVAAWRM
jgi:hypothetical protein